MPNQIFVYLEYVPINRARSSSFGNLCLLYISPGWKQFCNLDMCISHSLVCAKNKQKLAKCGLGHLQSFDSLGSVKAFKSHTINDFGHLFAPNSLSLSQMFHIYLHFCIMTQIHGTILFLVKNILQFFGICSHTLSNRPGRLKQFALRVAPVSQ